jgi:hypothetical protein
MGYRSLCGFILSPSESNALSPVHTGSAAARRRPAGNTEDALEAGDRKAARRERPLQELVEDLQSGIAEPALQLGTSAGGHQALCQYRARIARRQARLLFGPPAASKSHSPGQLVRFDVISYCSAWKPRSGRFGLCTSNYRPRGRLSCLLSFLTTSRCFAFVRLMPPRRRTKFLSGRSDFFFLLTCRISRTYFERLLGGNSG